MQIWNTARRNQRHPPALQDQAQPTHSTSSPRLQQQQSQHQQPQPQQPAPQPHQDRSLSQTPITQQRIPSISLQRGTPSRSDNSRRTSVARGTPTPDSGPVNGKANGTDLVSTQLTANETVIGQSVSALKDLLRSDINPDAVTKLNSKDYTSEPSSEFDIQATISQLNDDKFRNEIDAVIADDKDIFDILAIAEQESLDRSEEQTIVTKYEDEIEKFKDLHHSIEKCDTVLASVEDYLSLFEKDLGLLSTELETLQNRSIYLNKRLESRKELEVKLSGLIDDLLIPPRIVKSIVSGEINSQWIQYIQFLFTRIKRMESFTNEAQHVADSIALVDEIQPLLHMLAEKAVERIRNFFVQKIKSLRAPNVNAQVIQYSVFLKFRQLYSFLAFVNPQLAEEISLGYINTMRWYYSSNFGRYLKAIEKLQINVVDRTMLLGASDASRILPSARGPYANANRDPLILGRRVNIVFSTDSSVMMENTAEKNHETHWMETEFRSFNLALMDNVSAEYLFIVDFFTHKTPEQQAQLFQDIFQPTFDHGEVSLHKLLEASPYDAFGLLLCIRVIQLLTFELQRRNVPVMESYCNRLNMILWPRFQIIMDAHSDQLRRLSGRPSLNSEESGTKGGFARAGSAAWNATASLLSSSHITSALPHPVTQRFANFLHGILELSPEDMEFEPVSVSMVRLRNEFEAFLTKISSKVVAPGNTQSPQHQKQNSALRELFLYNNFMLVYTIISDAEGKLAEQEKAHFKILTEAYATQPTTSPIVPLPQSA
ncbi:Sac2 family-domain-containing protein [Lipomyces arxii]|uniref:Sac2 family-domain-containing protein n=1 Tax=Lipomyces arxii TaxID=56418 RepID=UPI0034CFB11F